MALQATRSINFIRRHGVHRIVTDLFKDDCDEPPRRSFAEGDQQTCQTPTITSPAGTIITIAIHWATARFAGHRPQETIRTYTLCQQTDLNDTVQLAGLSREFDRGGAGTGRTVDLPARRRRAWCDPHQKAPGGSPGTPGVQTTSRTHAMRFNAPRSRRRESGHRHPRGVPQLPPGACYQIAVFLDLKRGRSQ